MTSADGWVCVDGNEAAARVAHRLSEVIAIYPITPASPMGELADTWSAAGRPNLEGHAKITIQLDDAGAVADAHFHVTQFRGFERICQGRPVHALPSLMARICGICPVSHLVASAKACDQILAVAPPPTAVTLRRVLNLAQLVQSHTLSFFYLSSPDLLFGFDADPASRHLLGVLGANPQLARDGIALRRFGQQLIESLGGKRIHPGWVVPGGVDAPLQADTRDRLLATVPDARRRRPGARLVPGVGGALRGGGGPVRDLPGRLHGPGRP